jgi:hypothetical protein
MFLHLLAQPLVLILKKFKYLHLHLFEPPCLPLLQLPLGSLQVRRLYLLIHLLLLGSDWSWGLAHLADVNFVRVLESAGDTLPLSQQGSSVIVHLLMPLLLYLLLHLLNDLLLHQLVDVPPVHQHVAHSALLVNVQLGTQDLALVQLDDLLYLVVDRPLIEIGWNIAYLQDTFPLVVGGRTGHQHRHLFGLDEVVDLLKHTN